MTDLATHRFVRVGGTFEMEVEGHTVVVDRNSEQMITLNEVAGLIWNRIEVASTMNEIVEECHRRYPIVPVEQVEADVKEFLDHAASIGLVATDD
jgi:phosphopantetheine adenylyltransferase